MLCLNEFNEEDVFKDLSWLFHNEGPIYDNVLKPYLFCNEGALVFDKSNVQEFRCTLYGKNFHPYNRVLFLREICIYKKVRID